MKFRYEATLAMPVAEAFERLRAFARVYPELHAAHEPHAPGHEPELLHAGYRFELGERFGIERRRYAFVVEEFEPAAGAMRLAADTRTSWGPLALRTLLVLAFRLEQRKDGCRLEVVQRVSFGRPWLDRLLDRPALWRSVARHADEECAAAVRLLT